MYKDLSNNEKALLKTYCNNYGMQHYCSITPLKFYNRITRAILKYIETAEEYVNYCFGEIDSAFVARLKTLALSDREYKNIQKQNKETNKIIDNIDRAVIDYKEVRKILHEKYDKYFKDGIAVIIQKTCIKLCVQKRWLNGDTAYFLNRVVAKTKISVPANVKLIYYRGNRGGVILKHYDLFYKDEVENIKIDFEKLKAQLWYDECVQH